MAENEFEKRVQQKMDGFNLDPTPGVWKSVESRIRKEKKRRFIFWWLLLLAGGIGTTLLLTTSRQEREQMTTESGIPQPGSSPVRELDSTANISGRDTGTKIPVHSTPFDQADPLRNDRSIASNRNSEKKDYSPDKKNREVRDIDLSDVKNEKPGEIKTALIQQQTEVIKKEESALINPLSSITQKIAVNTDSPVVKLKSKDERPRINKWGISVSAGSSGFMNKFRFFNNGFFRADAMQSLPGSPLGSTNRNYSVQRAFSFSAELFVNRPVSPKLTLSGAMGYQYLSNRMLTGSRVNTATTINNWGSQGISVNSYYNIPGNSDNGYYTNQFHFLSLSGDVSWKFIEGKKFSLRWNNGLSYSRLLSSTMLHYANNQRVYYKDNNLLLKNQLFFNTALEAPVSKKLSVSPFLSFSITPVLKVDDSLKRHYNNYGIRIRYVLNKK